MEHTIQIREIIVLTSNNEITILGTINRNFLHFETEISVNSTQLNLIINQLQRLNPEVEISEMFQSRSSEKGQLLFFLEASDLSNSLIELHSFEQKSHMRQIRA